MTMSLTPAFSRTSFSLVGRCRLPAGALLGLLAAGIALAPLQAQTITSAVPGYISYQGQVVNSSGGLVGAGTPVNRTVTFRIWSHSTDATAGSLIYSEQQVVTIADGELSVLVGQGTATTGTPLGFSESAKGPSTVSIGDPGVFAGATRYLGVTVDDGTATVDPEISPRQQIVASAYAFRARYAESLGSNGNNAVTALDSGKVGVGNTNPPALLTVSGANVSTATSTPQLVVSADDVTERLRIGVTSTGNGTGFLQSFKEGIGAQNLLLNPHGGNVGVGTGSVAPVAQLDVNGVIGLFDGGSKSRYAGIATEVNAQLINFGVNNVRFGGAHTQANQGGMFRVDSRAGVNLFQFVGRVANSAAEAELVSITSAGNLGIGTTASDARLIVRSTTNSSGNNTAVFIPAGISGGIHSHLHHGTTGDIYWRSGNSGGRVILQDTGGNVGIGTGSPQNKLHVEGGGISIPSNQSIGVANWADRFSYNGHLVPHYGLGWYQDPEDGGGPMSYFSAYGGIKFFNRGRLLYEVRRDGVTVTHGQNYAYGHPTFSDERIKTDLQRSNTRTDLGIVRQLRVTDYRMIDRKQHGEALQKGFIAQEVQKLIPEAVSKSPGFAIPSIHAAATKVKYDAAAKTVHITLANPHGLKVGEQVRLSDEKGTYDLKVAEAPDARSFVAGPIVTPLQQVFVYGKHIEDMLAVDYSRIFTTGIGAVQELAQRVDTLQEENAELRTRVAELEKKDRARDAKLAAIERLLNSGGRPTVRPVSLQPTPRTEE